MTEPVVQPLMRILPFHNNAFTWEQFESFCLAVVRALPEVRWAERRGGGGERQGEVDIDAVLTDGGLRTIQCKHRKVLTLQQAEKTVLGTADNSAEHEIWVTGTVRAAANTYLRDREGWTFRSAEGISQTVRELPRETARRIVGQAFGGPVCRAFLGGPFAFETPQDHFAPFDDPGRLLRHDLPLVGRAAELDALRHAIESPARVVVLPGRGGIGKTRLLRAAAEALQSAGVRVVFARTAASLTTEAVDDLPLAELVVIVDDAHQADVNLGPLLAAVVRRSDPLTVVTTLRSGGVDAVRRAAADAQLESDQLLVLDALSSLPADDVATLAAAALGGESPRSRRLALATGELPVMTVLGGGLIARGSLHGTDEDLRAAVLPRFAAEVLGNVTPRVPRESARRLATVVAALQPLKISSRELVELVADELGVAASQVVRWIGDLEAAGLVLAHEDLRRITPEILADQFLLQECVDSAGLPTGYADELWRRYGEHSAATLLANLAELEWRPIARETSLLGGIRSQFEKHFRDADAWGREELIDTIRRAAFLLPDWVLGFARIELEYPADPTNWGIGVQIDHASVMAKLAPLLGAVGRHAEHAASAMALLWPLARDDARPVNAHPDHPLRVLEELGGQREAMLDLVKRELAEPGVDAHHYSPLELMRPLLARERTTVVQRGSSLQIGTLQIDPTATKSLRERARAVLIDQAIHGSARRGVEAAAQLHEALGPPHRADRARRDSWLQDELALLDAMDEIERESRDAAVRQRLGQGLDWHAEHSPWPGVRLRAAALRGRLLGPDEQLISAVADPWGVLDSDAKLERDAEVAARLIVSHPTGEALADALDALIDELVARGRTPSAHGVLAQACHGGRPLSSEEFEHLFGDLPSDGEG